MANKITLPSILSKDCWFYEDNKQLCDPHLGKPYISYSSSSSWENYKEDFIKQKFVKIKLPDGIYAQLGNYLGSAVETGEFGDNPNGFTGQENFHLIERPENAKYERMILIDRGEYCIIGFIDIFHEYEPKTVRCRDLKTGGKGKEKEYSSDSYTQVMLYSHALEQEGYKIGKTDVWFVRRTGSHLNPPLHISDEQFAIPLEYSPERVQYALEKIDKSVREISDCFGTYKKFFLN